MKVMIVDDSLQTRHKIATLLTEANHEVIHHAMSGEDALSQYDAFKPDVVLLSVTLLEQDGVRTLQNLVSQDSNARIIMLARQHQGHHVLDALTSGALGFLVHPVQRKDLEDEISRVLQLPHLSRRRTLAVRPIRQLLKSRMPFLPKRGRQFS